MSGDNTGRTVGAVIGFVISAAVVIYLDRQERPKLVQHHVTTARVVTTPGQTASQSQIVELHTQNAQQAEEIARLRLAVDADAALDQLRLAKPVLDPKRRELAHFTEMSRKELRGEIQIAVTDVVNYASEDTYAPDVHEALYRRVNTLWDIRGLQTDENSWLRQAVGSLNAIAVRHAEESFKDGDDAAVVRVVRSFGDWSYRLNGAQKQRLSNVLEQTVKRLRSGE